MGEYEQGIPTTEATTSILLDRDAYDEAVKACMDDLMKDKDAPDGMGKILYLMSGTAFASQLRRKLFGEEDK